jgi:hypothetical protein
VALPLPHPVGLLPGDEYKLALAFDGDRFLTPWLTVMGKRAPHVPLIEVELVRTARAVCARCGLRRAGRVATPPAFVAAHFSARPC